MAKANGKLTIRLHTITIKRVVPNVDFRKIMRYLETFSRHLSVNEGILLLNHRLTRWRIIGPAAEGGFTELRGYARKGEVYDLAAIEQMAAEGFMLGMSVPQAEAQKLAKLAEERRAA